MDQCVASQSGGLTGSSLLEWTSVLGMVFGGCCWNVFALEAVLKQFPSAGIFLTFAQFAYVTAQTASSQITFETKNAEGRTISTWIPRIRPRIVPLRRWFVQVVLFLAVSLMNNLALSLKVPLPVHIIFRSGGLSVSMAIGWLVGNKRYSALQVTSVCLVTGGILLATISAPPKAKARPPSITSSVGDIATLTPGLSAEMQYALGIALLTGALVLSAFMGLWQEGTYKRYGAVWKEGLFYQHFLSLPFFIPFTSSLRANFVTLSQSPPLRIQFPSALMPNKYPINGGAAMNDWYVDIPAGWMALATNVVTQGLCIGGVNRLTARVSAVSVNLILTVRKAVSLLISVVFYGSGFNVGLGCGATMVLLGTVLYTYSSPPPAVASKQDAQETQAIADTETNGVSSSIDRSKRPDNKGTELRERLLH